MNKKATVAATIIIAWLLFPSFCQAADETKRTDALETAWKSITPKAPLTMEQVAFWSVDKPDVSVFLSSKMETLRETASGFQDIVRMKAVLAANNEKGCIWLLAQSRMQSDRGYANAIRTSSDLDRCRELYRFLIDALTDPTETHVGTGLPDADMPVYSWRICDLAYLELHRRVSAEGNDAKNSGSKNTTQTATRPATIPGLPLGAEMEHSERNKHIQRLYEWFQTDAGKQFVAAKPSALAIVSKAKVMPAEVELVRLMLGRMHSTAAGAADIPSNVSLLDVLEHEIPPLSKSEEDYRQRLLLDKYSAKDVVVRLPQPILRNRGNIEWVLLKRKEHAQIAKALRELAQDKRAYKQIAIIEIAGELHRVWSKEDIAAAKEIADVLKDISADTAESWGIRLRAKLALEQEGGATANNN